MEHYYQKLFAYVGEILTLPETDKLRIRRSFKPVFFPRNTLIESAGQIPQHHNFIVSGHLRNFHVDHEGNEITTDLNDGSRFFTSYFHFMNRTVSPENIQCITDCELLRINRDDVEQGAQLSQTQKDYTIQILQKHLEEDKKRINDMANRPAEERYRAFLRDKPNIIRHVPLRYIASYLGITQRHLSRLRREITPDAPIRK